MPYSIATDHRVAGDTRRLRTHPTTIVRWGLRDTPALDALVFGLGMVARSYVNGGSRRCVVSDMVLLNLLREIDVLLGHAIVETSAALNMGVYRPASPTADHWIACLPGQKLDTIECRALRRLAGHRIRLNRHLRAASSGTSSAVAPPVHVTRTILAAAVRCGRGLAGRLSHLQASPSAGNPVRCRRMSRTA